MSKHTPGPWSVAARVGKYQAVPANEHERAMLESIKAVEFQALSVGHPGGQIAIVPLDESSPENANLLSAAPDMLEALEGLIELTIELDRHAAWDWGNDYAESNEVSKAKAAIAKAKGLPQ